MAVRLMIVKQVPKDLAEEIVSDLGDFTLEQTRAVIDVESRWRVARQATHPDRMVVEFRGVTGPRIDHQHMLHSDLARSHGKVYFGGSATTDINKIDRFLKDLGKIYKGESTIEQQKQLLAVDSRGYVVKVDSPILPHHETFAQVLKFVPESPVGPTLLEIDSKKLTFDSTHQRDVQSAMESALSDIEAGPELSALELESFYRTMMGDVGGRLFEHTHIHRAENAGPEWGPDKGWDAVREQISFSQTVYGDQPARPLPGFEPIDDQPAQDQPVEPFGSAPNWTTPSPVGGWDPLPPDVPEAVPPPPEPEPPAAGWTPAKVPWWRKLSPRNRRQGPPSAPR